MYLICNTSYHPHYTNVKIQCLLRNILRFEQNRAKTKLGSKTEIFQNFAKKYPPLSPETVGYGGTIWVT